MGWASSGLFNTYTNIQKHTGRTQISFIFMRDVRLNGVVLHAVEQVLQGI